MKCVARPNEECAIGFTRSLGPFFVEKAGTAKAKVPPNDLRNTEGGFNFWHLVPRLFALACVGALLLEAGTLFGAPVATPLNPSDWSLKRMLAFAITLFAVFAYVAWRLSRSGESPYLNVSAKALGKETLGVIIPVVSGLLIARLGFVVIGSEWDMRWGYGVAAALVLVTELYRHRDLAFEKLEYGFLIIGLTMGTLFCLVMPFVPTATWDGHIHFSRIIATSYLTNPEYTGSDQLLLRTDAVAITGLKDHRKDNILSQASHDPKTIERAENVVTDAELSVPAKVGAGAVSLGEDGTWAPNTDFNRVGYLPYAIGMWLGRLLHMDPLARYLLSRLASMTCYVLVFFFAARQLKSGKAIVCAIGLLPTPLLMASGFSYDPWLISVTTFSFAKFASIAQRGMETDLPAEASSMLLAFVLASLTKAVMFPLALVFLFLPGECFSSKRDRKAYGAAVVAAALILVVSFALPFVMASDKGGDMRGGTGVDSGGQLAFVLQSPVRYMAILGTFMWGFITDHNAVTSYINMFTGAPYVVDEHVRLVWPAFVEIALVVVASLVDRSEHDARLARPLVKLAVFIGSLASLSLISTAMYISFTEVGSPTIVGVQFRYLLPFFAPVFLVGCDFRLFTALSEKCGRVHFSALQANGAAAFLCAETALLFVVFCNYFF